MENKHSVKHRCSSRFGEISRKAKRVGRIVAFLTREQIDFVDKIGKDSLFSTGKKLSRTEIIQAIVEAARKLNFTGRDIHSVDELEERMHEVAKKGLADLAEGLKKEKEKKHEVT